MQTIQETIEQLHGALREYIEATYHISSASLIAQRRELLNDPGAIYQVPYLESTPRYQTGELLADMKNLPAAALELFRAIAHTDGALPRLVYDPPYRHQSESIRCCLIEGQSVVIMTGTGSGKTESFLLPILGKLAREAKERPEVFEEKHAMRSLVLYPMNALVNDQLGRLRSLFGDPRLVRLFKSWAGRPPRFARYTSRTPYAGVRTSARDSRKLKSFDEFFLDILRRSEDSDEETRTEALRLLAALKERGKWPAKPDLAAWFGEKGSRWQDAKSGEFVRAVTLPDDSELLTRYEVQTAPPDLLVTNYSMLEYMLMRPIERTVFDRTREWLAENPDEKFLVVLDEAHLYRGASGAEVGLLLRRLRDRLGVPTARFQVICATASFNNPHYAREFGAQLSGLPEAAFAPPITGELALNRSDNPGSVKDAEILAAIDVDAFHGATSEEERQEIVRPLLEYRRTDGGVSVEQGLYKALIEFGPMGHLINVTMERAWPIADLGAELFPDSETRTADGALTALMALGSAARPDSKEPGLLPCRVHNFFRGLPGLWVCMDPDCRGVPSEQKEGICGRMFSQPRERCECGARVLELFTCRNCGTAYARAYTDDVDAPSATWAEPGEHLRMAEQETSPLLPLDLLLEEPIRNDVAEPADYDLETGRLNPRSMGPRMRTVYVRSDRVVETAEEDDESSTQSETRGQFIPCAVCGRSASFGRSSVQDHQTKGDQPFQALVARQIQIQPPVRAEASAFAPLQGRKVLAFSDSRQVAARLAPNLQMYSVRDSLRPLIAWGFRKLQMASSLEPHLSLEDLYLAVLLGSKCLGVRLRPELKAGESFNIEERVEKAIRAGETDTDAGLLGLYVEVRNERPPAALLDSIVTTLRDRFLGFEALALGSIVERSKHAAALEALPALEGVAETPEAKVALARAWLRCWQGNGFWLSGMPPVWWRRPRAEGTSVRGQKGKFKAMETVIQDATARKAFWSTWSPALLDIFTEPTEGGFRRLRGGELSLFLLGGSWVHCIQCKSVHRPVPGLNHCLDCGSERIGELDPDSNPVFLARKGFYRKPVMEALATSPRKPMALIAAEHTAQLNAPQSEDVFSKAEENELLFQDIAIASVGGGTRSTAIDVLSSTTTMEVGIDIGSLSGVALRNMPPGRANYQQRSGRAGRRGTAVATVLAFGSADSHDEHYFSQPDEMIRGAVVDPTLTLDNPDIARRHILAFALQSYHQDRLPVVDASQRHDLFSVLGTVAEFRSGDSPLNRDDFAQWLTDNEASLQARIASWIPEELKAEDRENLLNGMKEDCLREIDDAIRPEIGDDATQDDDEEEEGGGEAGEDSARSVSNASTKLLDRLLYCGKLPRYAFPTDVATFHVFDRERSTAFRPIMRFAPSQGLPIALSQYAPGKQVWISGKCYTSGALYSVMRDDLFNAWQDKKIYMECSQCGFARTYRIGAADRGETRDCEACEGQGTFGPARYWLRPPGFAHPIDVEEVTSPDEVPETSYATRAKLTMSPDEATGWVQINSQIRALSARQHLLVSNTGPKRDGYTYCTKCGRIEASSASKPTLAGPHRKPYPEADDRVTCDGIGPTRHIVLGTDFITDIALFSMRVQPPLSLRPGHTPTAIALRTVSEALAKAVCQLLEIEPGELMAEYRPALTPEGARGLEAEIFLYDTLPGGAGFSSQLAGRGRELYERALLLVRNCPGGCDASCYRCLRSFKNKFEHGLLDRHVGAYLLEVLLTGKRGEFDQSRIAQSTELLFNDLVRQSDEGGRLELDATLVAGSREVRAPILWDSGSERSVVIALSAPLTPGEPADPRLLNLTGRNVQVIVENELLVRGNLPAVTRSVQQRLRG